MTYRIIPHQELQILDGQELRSFENGRICGIAHKMFAGLVQGQSGRMKLPEGFSRGKDESVTYQSVSLGCCRGEGIQSAFGYQCHVSLTSASRIGFSHRHGHVGQAHLLQLGRHVGVGDDRELQPCGTSGFSQKTLQI